MFSRTKPNQHAAVFVFGMMVAAAITTVGYRNFSIAKQPKLPVVHAPAPDIPASLAIWPWPHSVKDKPHAGVTHWLDKSSPDGVTVELFDFDFSANPHLRFEIYDQDEDGVKPFGNHVDFWKNGVGQVTHHLNELGRGPVVAAWNGLFFDLSGQGPTAFASHLTPVVLNGRLHYQDQGNYRWTFGVKYKLNKPEFNVMYLPTATEMGQLFDFAAGAAQCLVREGKALTLGPYPPESSPSLHLSHGGERNKVTHTLGQSEDEAGYIPIVDSIKVSRASIGWSKDSCHLYLLFAKSPDMETENAIKFKHSEPVSSGWNVADLQRFWLAKGVWGAINSDGGEPAQLAYRLPDGKYVLIPPRWAASNTRRIVSSDFPNAPAGGSLMYFYVRDSE